MLYHGRIIAAVPGWNNSVCRITLLHRHTHSITSINVNINYYSLFGRNDFTKTNLSITDDIVLPWWFCQICAKPNILKVVGMNLNGSPYD